MLHAPREKSGAMFQKLLTPRGDHVWLEQAIALQRDLLTACALARPAVALAPLPRSRALRKLVAGTPLLHREPLDPDVPACRDLFGQLVEGLQRHGPSAAAGRALAAAATGRLDFERALFEALANHADHLRELATWSAVDADALESVLALVVRAPLHALSGRISPLLALVDSWQRTYCPVCGAWPELAEAPGPDLTRRLRCLRCGAGWTQPSPGCIFCGHRGRLRSLATAGRETHRSIEACDVCGAYIKVFRCRESDGLNGSAEAALAVLPLDVAALEYGYHRPHEPGFRLELAETEHGGFGEDELEFD